jgi:hypothetical protein
MAGTIAPIGRHQFFTDAGVPLAGGLLYSYASGTSTPATTYSDAALSVANANPLVLDAGGRGTIFLAATSYKFVLKSSAGVTIWTVDGVSSTSVAASQAVDNSTCQGRISLTSGTPVTVADVTAATSVYWTPYKGNKVALYDGSAWNIRTFAELSLSLGSDTASRPYDLFAYDNSSVVAIERLVWTSATARATALALQDGVYVKSGDATRRYLGTYYTTATGQTEDSLAKRLVWNYYHRVSRGLRVTEATDTWTYTTATFRQANGAVGNQVAVVVGVAESLITLGVKVRVFNSGTTAVNAVVSIGEDSTTTPATGALMDAPNVGHVANFTMPSSAALETYPAIGYHFYVWLEYSTALGTTTWAGDGGVSYIRSGMTGSIEG